MGGLTAAVLLSTAMGFALAGPTIVPATGKRASSLLLALSLGVGVGLGISACAFFIWLAFVGSVAGGVGLMDLAVLLAGVAFAARALRRRGAAVGPVRRPLGWMWGGAVSASMIVAAAFFVVRSLRQPHGDWDAWMTWNRTARFLFRGSEQWHDAFSASFRHPDYPLLIPAAVARMWTYIGTDSPVAPATVALLFTFATVGLAGAALAVLRTPRQGVLAALVLFGTASLLTYGAAQYADVPLAFFMLATVVLMFLHDRAGAGDVRSLMALAGACAGLAAWTKNEGVLFVGAVVAARVAAVVWQHGWRRWLGEAWWFAVGLAPGLAVVAYFKLSLAPTNDLVAGQGLAQTLPRLLEGARYAAVGRAFFAEAWRLGDTGIVGAIPVLVLYVLCVGRSVASTDRGAVATSVAAFTLVLAGYALVLVTAPEDFLRLLNRSVDRLLLHLWPAVVFTAFMVARPPEDAPR